MTFAPAARLLDEAVGTRASPGAVVEVGDADGTWWRYAAGRLSYDEQAPPTTAQTIFDLASLTKVIATTSLVMRWVDRGVLDLDTPVCALCPAWGHGERGRVTIRHLLEHSSGLPARLHLWESGAGRDTFLRTLATVALERPPGQASVYSDLGFILLGLVLEMHEGQPLDVQIAALATAAGATFRYGVAAEARARVAPTEFDPWRGRLLVGEVHDENAAALGGVAGHAGLFGTVEDVGAFARLVLRTFRTCTALGSPALMAAFSAPSLVPGSSRALGWDTMRPTSSCGRDLSPSSIGHTGFTGPSLWIDHERGFYVALLANRVHPTRANDRWLGWRPKIHEAIAAAIAARN